MNEVYCDDCFRRLWPKGHEEKSCCHGVYTATCLRCGKVRVVDEKPYWHCLGKVAEETVAVMKKFYRAVETVRWALEEPGIRGKVALTILARDLGIDASEA